MSDHDGAGDDPTRRELLARLAALSLLLGLSWPRAASAAPSPPPPADPYKATRDGATGPFGDVRLYRVGEWPVPVTVTAASGLGVMDFTPRAPFVRIGTAEDATAIVLSSAGIRFGASKSGVLVPWSPDAVRRLVKALASDREKTRGLMLLRSALHTGYPVAASKGKGKPPARLAASLAAGALGYGVAAMRCTTQTITESVTRTIMESVAVVRTAEQQYQACYDREAGRAPCQALGFLAGPCAAASCAAQAFVDVVTGFVTIVTTVAEEVVREVVVCATRPVRGRWGNPWDVGDRSLLAAAAPTAAVPTDKPAVTLAVEFLAKVSGIFGEFGKCLLAGEWKLTQLELPVDLGGGNVVVTSGVEVCLSAECASRLISLDMASTLLSSWGAGLGLLAALSPEFAAMAATLGITATAAVATAAAAAPPAAVAIAALIVVDLLVILWHGTAIVAQLAFHKLALQSFDDGRVCIQHPTLAVATIMLLLAPTAGAAAPLIPPIVTG